MLQLSRPCDRQDISSDREKKENSLTKPVKTRPGITKDVHVPNNPLDSPSNPTSPCKKIRACTGSDRSLSHSGKIEPMVPLYRFARQHEWEKVSKHCKHTPRDARYINPVDGTTALHVAVMSRTGYSPEEGELNGVNSEPKIHTPAPLHVIEELLQAHAYAAMEVCSMNTYTPLSYACLVSGDDWNLEDAASMVRLFLQYAPDCLQIFTAGGLSALDVHIISYSHKQQDKEEAHLLSGRSSTVVLRTLLEAEPALASPRVHRDKVGGPIELLYRCNSAWFLKAASRDDQTQQQTKMGTSAVMHCDEKTVINSITNWWVWKWAILILKYGTLRYKQKGTPFLTVQAAAKMIGCPLPLLALAMKAFPRQPCMPDVMHGVIANFPLHEVCTWPCEQDCVSSDPVITSRKSMAISTLLQVYSHASLIPNGLNQTALELAVQSGTMWDGGVRKLVRCNPMAVSIRSPTTGLLPFMTAAAVARVSEPYQQPQRSSKRSLMTHLNNMAKRDLQSVRTIFGLLRAAPDSMGDFFVEPKEEPDKEDSADFSNLRISHRKLNLGNTRPMNNNLKMLSRRRFDQDAMGP